MLEQIKEVQDQGFKPVIFIEKCLMQFSGSCQELIMISRTARKMNIPVLNEETVNTINRMRNIHIFRYGMIPIDTEMMVRRKGGKIVSGNLRAN